MQVVSRQCGALQLLGHVPKQCCTAAMHVAGHKLWRFALASFQVGNMHTQDRVVIVGFQILLLHGAC